MINTIVVFQKQEDARGISNLLLRNGYNVSAVCTSGAMALSNIDEMDYGIIVCGYSFNDMKYFELAENLPDTFQSKFASIFFKPIHFLIRNAECGIAD